MDVNLDDLVVIDHDDAVADGLEEVAQLLGIGFDLGVSADDKLGAVGEFDVVVELGGGAVKVIDGHLGALVIGNDLAVLEGCEHTLEDGAQTLAARVNYARLFEYGEQLGSESQRVVRLVDDGLPYGKRIVVLLGSLNARLIRHSCYGENRALRRLGDSLVGGVYADSESGGNILAVDLLHVLQPLSEASEQNGGDNARVASCASEH